MSQLAVNGGPPIRATPYPAWPDHGARERELLAEVLDSGRWWSTQGTKVAEFEQRWGEFHATGPALAVTNGSHAIELALLALGIGAGDEVIVPDWTFFATAASVLMVNAIPVLVDVHPGTGCIDPALVEAAITSRTAAVLAVHIAGHPADLDALTDLCDRHHLALIEDCAHAHGSTWNDRPVGTFGEAGTYSFQASKLMTGGEGGALVSRRPEVVNAARSFGDCGRRPGEWFYDHYLLGGNNRMTEWQGAVLLAQLERFDRQQALRSANADRLNAELATIEGITPQGRDPRCTVQGNYCYLVEIDAETFGGSREAVRRALVAEGIPLTQAYPPIHRLHAFRDPDGFAPRWRNRNGMADFASLSMPVSEHLADTTLWFTTSVLMGSSADTMDVVRAITKVHELAAELPTEV